MTDEARSGSLKRRDLLKMAGMLAAAPAAAPFTRQQQGGDGPPPTPLRAGDLVAAPRPVTPPPLPPLNVIALNRMAFGPRPGDLSAFNVLGATDEDRIIAYVNQQVNPAAINDNDCDTRLFTANYPTLYKSLEQMWADHFRGDYGSSEPFLETTGATWIRAIYSKRQLFEVLVDFWHNHFNIYGWNYLIRSVFMHYDRDVIRSHALGNFRQMLGAVAMSPAMLYYLDNYISQGSGFNENYARELIELHTMGAENYLGVMDPNDVPVDENGIAIGYVDNDVYEAARCLTGWSFDYGGSDDTGVFEYKSDYHDRANKFFLKHYIPADQADMQDGNFVLDKLASHPGTARHIARKLCRRLISDDPPQAVVDAAATVFQNNFSASDQLRRVVRTILLSDEFRTTWGEKVNRPFEAVAGALRATDAEFSFSNDFRYTYDNTAHELFSHPPPDGYPDTKDDWTNTTSMLQRWRVVNRTFEGWIDDVSIDVLSQTSSLVRTPNGLADFWINRLLGRPMHPQENRDEIVDFLAQGRNPDYDLTEEQFEERLPRAVALILMGPDFQLR